MNGVVKREVIQLAGVRVLLKCIALCILLTRVHTKTYSRERSGEYNRSMSVEHGSMFGKTPLEFESYKPPLTQ